jgi:PEP-CTERM motif
MHEQAGNNLYVVNSSGAARPMIFSIGEYGATTGAAINAELVTSGLSQPAGIAVFGGDLFVTNALSSSLGTVGEYDAISGAVLNSSVVTGLSSPLGIIVVPEPSTLVLLTIGTVSLLWARRQHAFPA